MTGIHAAPLPGSRRRQLLRRLVKLVSPEVIFDPVISSVAEAATVSDHAN
jgi:hypothetical protein